MTPDEAKTKWCPFFRSKGPVDQWSDNRDHGGAGFCIGPSCMAWRFGMELRMGFRVADPATAHDEPQRPAGIPASWVWEPAVSDKGEPAGWVEPMAEALARQEGYCGLAGKDGAP